MSEPIVQTSAPKRRRVVPVAVSREVQGITGAVASPGQQSVPSVPKGAAEEEAAGEGFVWASDSSGIWEVRVRGRSTAGVASCGGDDAAVSSCAAAGGAPGSSTVGSTGVNGCVTKETISSQSVCGIKGGKTMWEFPLQAPVQRLVVDGGYAALATCNELLILGLTSGFLVFPPFRLGSVALHLELDANGHLMVLARDGSLAVWDIRAATCLVKTTLRHMCQPSSVLSIGFRQCTAEPLVRLTDQSLLVFHRGLQAWTTLLGSGGIVAGAAPEAPTTRSGEEAAITSASGGREGVSAEGSRLEGDMLAAACLGDVDEFRERLRRVIRYHAMRAHASPASAVAIRDWCGALVAQATASVEGKAAEGDCVRPRVAWLVSEIAGMGLDGALLISEDVLPSLGGTAARSRELRAEIEALVRAKHEQEGPEFRVF
eukprot:TRINITY_DN11194_c0_g1_i1.p1 TRINITY_DN11194_c0_g1~~TRINITY_DN11194_c0_g1_i1.p1  ORF type:complete len:430 (+),score=63.87 TRINITY_DN11194_c0_g1_i1:120-1409(+)